MFAYFPKLAGDGQTGSATNNLHYDAMGRTSWHSTGSRRRTCGASTLYIISYRKTRNAVEHKVIYEDILEYLAKDLINKIVQDG